VFKLIAKHTELKSLSWPLPEFIRLLNAGEFSRPDVYAVRLAVNFFGIKFDLPVFGAVYIKTVKVKK